MNCHGVGGGEVKNQRGEIWEVPSDHNTTRIFEGPLLKNFQNEKKLAGEDPLEPLTPNKTEVMMSCSYLSTYLIFVF
jgi:hypothetical protein